MRVIVLNKILFCLALLILLGCGSSALVSTPVENIDVIPLKISDLSAHEKKTWSHLDLIADTIPGMSVKKAYSELIKSKKGQTTIVAVIDSGIDIDHEDLSDVIWTNKDEIPNNGKDDDNNGYVDDIHGWNFLGDTFFEQFEYVRLLATGNTNDPDYNRAVTEYNREFQRYEKLKSQYEQLIQQVNTADKAITKKLKKSNYTRAEVNAIETESESLQQSIAIINFIYSLDFETVADAKETFNDNLKTINNRLNYNLNKTLKGRKTNDNPNDLSDIGYGDNNVKPKNEDESHGTHVAGIIAAKRNNNKGVNGIANNVQIMAIRNTPRGDEYDKDVSLAIRYAVDNGAKIINMSFGKYFSPHKDWVKDAIVYAGENDVLIIHGAGNEALNLDNTTNYPNDVDSSNREISDNFLSVGALDPKYGSGLLANYSNYGKSNVDVFAPGSSIYSTYPNNTYKSIQGTSMAAPGVTGVAALIRSLYPNLKANQVKQIIIESGFPITTKLVVGGDSGNIKTMSQISKSGSIVNAYNALVRAEMISSQ